MKIVYLSALAALSATANAQWTMTNLHPPGATFSGVVGAGGNTQTGWVDTAAGQHASLWSGTSASWQDFNPAGATGSLMVGNSGGRQFGAVDGQAGLWSGTANSFVSIHPAGATYSSPWAIDGSSQVGDVGVAGIGHASLWSGTAASWQDLHPLSGSYYSSGATSVSGSIQGGVAYFGSQSSNRAHAGFWTGTAGSWIDLHPVAATESFVYGVGNNQQAGTVYTGTVRHATRWSGTAGSAIDLHPAGTNYSNSEAYGAWGGYQFGYVTIQTGRKRASLWNGSSSSWFNLGSFMPAGYTDSEAYAMSSDGIKLYVAGYARHTASNQWQAVVWTQPVPEPRTLAVLGVGIFAILRRKHRS